MRPIALGRNYAQHRIMRRSLRQDPLCVIPALLGSDTGPVPGSDRADSFWVVAEEAPGALTGVEGVADGVPDAGNELVLATVGAEVLYGLGRGEWGGRVMRGVAGGGG